MAKLAFLRDLEFDDVFMGALPPAEGDTVSIRSEKALVLRRIEPPKTKNVLSLDTEVTVLVYEPPCRYCFSRCLWTDEEPIPAGTDGQWKCGSCGWEFGDGKELIRTTYAVMGSMGMSMAVLMNSEITEIIVQYIIALADDILSPSDEREIPGSADKVGGRAIRARIAAEAQLPEALRTRSEPLLVPIAATLARLDPRVVFP